MRKQQLSIWIAVGMISLIARPAFLEAQYVVPEPRTSYYFYYGPGTALSAQVHAQADLVRAAGEASVNYARARERHARAYRQEIANSVAKVRAHWERRRIGEEERAKRAFDYLKSKRKANRKRWERLRDHPDLQLQAIANGKALNFLLDRLSVTMFGSQFTLADLEGHKELTEEYPLNQATLRGLRLQRTYGGGELRVFRATDGKALQVIWWPYVLREDKFEQERERFEHARKRAVEVAAEEGELPKEIVEELYVALQELQEALYKQAEENSTSNELGTRIETWQRYKVAERFLKRLAGRIERLRTTADPSAFDGSRRFEGKDLPDLLSFMAHNGLRFAPATPGDEPAYHRVFGMMRKLYKGVADEDPGLRKERESSPFHD